MRYKDYLWPQSPGELHVRRTRDFKDLKLPFWGAALQELGPQRRVVTGSGVFLGKEAARDFHRLAEVFACPGAGILELPGHAPFRAVFSALELLAGERPEEAPYSFTFLEEEPPAPAARAAEEYVCAEGESLWAVASRTGRTVSAILAANRIRCPACLSAGQRLVLP